MRIIFQTILDILSLKVLQKLQNGLAVRLHAHCTQIICLYTWMGFHWSLNIHDALLDWSKNCVSSFCLCGYVCQVVKDVTKIRNRLVYIHDVTPSSFLTG